MVLLNQGIEAFRDAITAIIDEGQLGRDGTEVAVTDTAILDPITGTDKTLTVTNINKGFKTEFQTSAGDGSGNPAREYVITDTNGDAVARATFPQIDIGATTVVTITDQVLFIQEL